MFWSRLWFDTYMQVIKHGHAESWPIVAIAYRFCMLHRNFIEEFMEVESLLIVASYTCVEISVRQWLPRL